MTALYYLTTSVLLVISISFNIWLYFALRHETARTHAAETELTAQIQETLRQKCQHDNARHLLNHANATNERLRYQLRINYLSATLYNARSTRIYLN